MSLLNEKGIRDLTAALHGEITWLLQQLATLSFEQFVAANKRPEVTDGHVDASQKISFFRKRTFGADFKFLVTYAAQHEPELSIFGERSFLGLVIMAGPAGPVSVCLNTSLAPTPYGLNVGPLREELLKLPNTTIGFVEIAGSRTGVPDENSIMFMPPGNSDFEDVAKWHPSQMSTMPIVRFLDDGGAKLIGTCFAIHPTGVAITARHVLDEALGIGHDQEYRGLGPDCLEHVGVFFWSDRIDVKNNRPYADFLAIGWFFAHPGLDIAIIKLVLPLDNETKQEIPVRTVALSPGIPKPGIACFGFGYPRMDGRRDENLRLLIEQDFKSTAGVIQEVHFPQRDASVMPFPCFQTSARFAGGMSGGPIISQTGQVCGVICSGFETDDTEGGYISYGSLIGPVLGFRIVAAAADGSPVEILVNDLVAAGSINVDDTYRDLKVIKLPDRQIIDFGDERHWAFSLASGQNRLRLRERFYHLRYGDVIRDWHVFAAALGCGALAGLAALALGYSLEQAEAAAFAGFAGPMVILMLILRFLTNEP